jgi:hypothetical protein
MYVFVCKWELSNRWLNIGLVFGGLSLGKPERYVQRTLSWLPFIGAFSRGYPFFTKKNWLQELVLSFYFLLMTNSECPEASQGSRL